MLYRFKKAFLLAVSTSVIVMALVFVVVRAGSLTPLGPVGSTMHSLLEIYNSIAGSSVNFTGSATDLNDMTLGTTFTGGTSLNYRVQIDAIGAPDTFEWSDDGGVTWDATGVAITGLAQTLNNGVTVTFGATTGHTAGNRWDFYRKVANINGNIIEQLKYISGMTLQQIYNNSGATPTIAGTSGAGSVLTIKKSDAAAGKIIELKDSADAVVFSVDNAGKISSASGQIKAATGSTFYNEGGYAIAKAGEEILRASIPIFGYDFPARYANSSAAIKISRDITLDANSFPVLPAGADRRYKFKIQYANNAVNANNSSWQIINITDPLDVYAPFNVSNTNIANLDEAIVYYTSAIATLPSVGQKWYLQVTAPAATIIQIYQIELLAYDVLQ